jgi:hypothetical protein
MLTIVCCSDTKPITLDGDNSPSSSQTISQKWSGLSPTTKYIIIGVVCGVVGLAVLIFAFCCIRQRRAGKHEKLIEDAKYEKMQGEVMAYRADMNRMRSEQKLMASSVEHFSPVSPMMGNAGATFGQSSPMMGGRSPSGGYPYGHPARGYQRY